MAGNSEVCSHIGALLFAAEYANRNKGVVSCTDVAALWPMPTLSTVVPIVPVAEMNFGKFVDLSTQHIPSNTKEGVVNLLKRIESLGRTASIMRIVEPFASNLQIASNITLPDIFNIFNEEYISKNYVELMNISKTLVVSLDKKKVLLIEEHTRGQHTSNNWYVQRAGRITASKLKSVCRTSKESPSLSLIKSICYPTKVLFQTKATEWGLKHELDAVEQYRKTMEEHENFILNDVGLVINPRWPQLGASPDKIVYCECCLGGALEVKCPYLLNTKDINDVNEYVKLKNSCVIVSDGQIILKHDHQYYYQVQMQIFVCNLQYCDFVIWSPRFLFKERIYPDFEFWAKYSQTALKFHSEVIVPELLGRYFTRKEGSAKLNYWCICNGVDDGTPMLQCDNDECSIKWFHFKCLNISCVPDSEWYCTACQPNK